MAFKRWWLIFSFPALIFFNNVSAKENVGAKKTSDKEKKKQQERLNKKLAAGCDPASAFSNLDINNVRARILNGGDMWWDLVSTARYEIPKTKEPPHKTALFAGALWIGGYDQGNNLRLAAMTYRQGQGYDFFPGPLDTTSASITREECKSWDKIWKVDREEIEEFREQGPSAMTDDIRNWPAHGDPSKGQSKYLAPFVDVDKNGEYDPFAGDYPDIFGDQALWFVYNDKGNIHTETEAPAIGLEVRTMAFAFSTNDEVNNMTFYDQTIINRSKDELDSVFFGQWVDADLGYAFDDYVGCDTTRDLGICYNGDDFDETVNGYGSNPPSVAVDFFQGPKDAKGNQIGMEYFVYYNNDFSPYGNPNQTQHYYNYLTGTWKNGDRITCGGNGRGSGSSCHYMYPGDPTNPQEWSEVSVGNVPSDRRFIQSAGPFTLKPGAVNKVVIGAVWAKATTGGNTGSYDLLLLADDKAQQLYNNDFDILDGPDAPDVNIQEMNQELILSFTETRESEAYKESILSTNVNDTITYVFQGYEIYQLKNGDVTPAQLDNPDVARRIKQVDVRDKVDVLVNKIYDPSVNQKNARLMISGDNQGIRHTFSITKDAFASGEDHFVNYRPYYFMVIAYASADPEDSASARADIQYLAGRRNVKTYTGIPHSTRPELDGAAKMANFGDRPPVTRMEGDGNGGMVLELSDQTEQEILNKVKVDQPVYDYNGGPVNVTVYDPLKLPGKEFEIRLVDPSITTPQGNYKEISRRSKWVLSEKGSNELIHADTFISANYEQVLTKYGLSIKIDHVTGPKYDTVTETQGFLEASITFEDDQERWLTGIQDQDAPGSFNSEGLPYPPNWIRSGQVESPSQASDYMADDAFYISGGQNSTREDIDPNGIYEEILDGIVAPYGVVARAKGDANGRYTLGPAIEASFLNGSVNNMHSVDVVFTPNKDLWTRCVVVEMSSDENLAEGQAKKFYLREHASIDKEGNEIQGDKGRSWFPGYAINLETGERLNIIFGEDSWLVSENGNDMIWNPTDKLTNPATFSSDYSNYLWGGKHFIYVMNSYGTQGNRIVEGRAYDEGKFYQETLMNGTSFDFRNMYAAAMWVTIPVLSDGYNLKPLDEGLIPTKTRIRLRVSRPYRTYKTGSSENNNVPFYTFNTSSLAPEVNKTIGKTALNTVKVTPNPYYAFSEYEQTQLDNRVRILNLPRKCKVTIHTLDGTLVRTLVKDQTKEAHVPYLDWNLKNQADIPIGSGIYMIHIDATELGLGEKTIKWLAVMRPLDLDTF